MGGSVLLHLEKRSKRVICEGVLHSARRGVGTAHVWPGSSRPKGISQQTALYRMGPPGLLCPGKVQNGFSFETKSVILDLCPCGMLVTLAPTRPWAA